MKTFDTTIYKATQRIAEGRIKNLLHTMTAASMLGTSAMADQQTKYPVTAPPLKYEMPHNIGGRLNNPGNVKYNRKNKWEGQTGKEGGFVKFSNPEYGVRSLFKLIQTYRVKYKLNTVNGIISKYAPHTENSTQKYIKFVCDRMGVKPDDKLNLSDSNVEMKLIGTMIEYETGYKAPIHLLYRGLKRAR